MGIAIRIVSDSATLHRFDRQLACPADRMCGAGENTDFQGRQSAPCIPIADIGQVAQRVIIRLHLETSQAAFAILQCPSQQPQDVVLIERLEFEDLAAADQRAVHGEERIGGGGAHQRDDPFLDVGQEGILLGFVESMNFIDEQYGFATVGGQFVACLLQDGPQFFYAACHRTQRSKSAAASRSQEARQRRFATARWSIKNHRAQAIGLNQPAQQLALAQKMLLPNKLVQRTGTHPCSQRSRCF